MQAPLHDSTSGPEPHLSTAEYQRLRSELAVQLKSELRRSGQQQLFSMGIHALVMLFLAVLLFISSRRYHDLMLWAMGLCLLLFSLLEFMDLDFIQSGHSLFDVFRRNPRPKKKQLRKTPPPYIPGEH